METKTPKSYLEAFQATDKILPDHFELMGNCLLVRELPAPEVKTKSGIVLPGSGIKQVDGFEANRPCWVEVLKVGAGYISEDGDSFTECDSKPGDIVLVGKLSVKWVSHLGPIHSTHENNLGLVLESEIQARFRGRDTESQYYATLTIELAG